ncbi:MAG TPA: hypothetical protein VNA89_02920 [Gemmatimonadaceae bacterium]|nr:hypothetical protein [Gemmatimonadaceae bacterium]
MSLDTAPPAPQVVRGASADFPEDLAEELPGLLWLYHMGIVLFWIHDSSPGRARTHRLVDQSVDLVARLVAVASNPLMRPLRKRALALARAAR